MFALRVFGLAAFVVFAAEDILCRDEAALLQQQSSIVPATLRARAERVAKAAGARQAASAITKDFPSLLLFETQLEAFPDFVRRKIETPWGEVAALWLALGAFGSCCFCMVLCCWRSHSSTKTSQEHEDEYKINFTLANKTSDDILGEEEGERQKALSTIQEARNTYMERMTEWFTGSTDAGKNASDDGDGCGSVPTQDVTTTRAATLLVPSTPPSGSARPDINKLNLGATRRLGSPDERPRSRLSPCDDGQRVTHCSGSASNGRRSRLMSPRQEGQGTVSTPKKSALKGSPRQMAPACDSEARKSRVSFRPALLSDEEHRAS
jgi:hypothetical protein